MSVFLTNSGEIKKNHSIFHLVKTLTEKHLEDFFSKVPGRFPGVSVKAAPEVIPDMEDYQDTIQKGW